MNTEKDATRCSWCGAPPDCRHFAACPNNTSRPVPSGGSTGTGAVVSEQGNEAPSKTYDDEGYEAGKSDAREEFRRHIISDQDLRALHENAKAYSLANRAMRDVWGYDHSTTLAFLIQRGSIGPTDRRHHTYTPPPGFPDRPDLSLPEDRPGWIEGWQAALDWLAEHKGFEGIALAEEMSTGSQRPVRRDRLMPNTESDATQIRLMENLYGLRQVWCVVYDSPNPSMDGSPHPIRMADQDCEIAVRNYEFMQRQQRVSPKKNLRIETRWVSDYTDVTTTVIPPGE